MILYALRCVDGHAFEGWFRDSNGFETQQRDGLLTCPECGSAQVDRALMAPALARSAPAPREVLEPASKSAVLPDAVRSALQKLRAEIERHSEHVGSEFATQALAMHRGEIAHRPIHGDATEPERERLHDAGVEVQTIPWLPRADG